MSTKKKSLDLHLMEIFKQCIAIKDEDYKHSQEIFNNVFSQVREQMGKNCNYFKKYSSQVLFAGSVYDGIKITKLDEFDMDIVIRLPISYDENINGIIVENDQPGFVKMKIGKAFDELDKQQGWEHCHKVTRDWRDTDKYFLQSEFRRWLHGIVQKAVNDLKEKVVVNNVTYLLKYKESGPAFTLNIRNEKGNEPFLLDVDLVPVIRFMHPRWPAGYRKVEQSKDWFVVPKPNKAMNDETIKKRCWRLSFQDHERDIMKGCQQLKTTIRLVKKLRDTLGMKAIASYYIKTLFLWKIEEKKVKTYWQKKVSELFEEMVRELHTAITKKNIPYFWQKNNNLIATLKPTHQKIYADKLKEVLDCIATNNVDRLITFLLNSEELLNFQKSSFYKSQYVSETMKPSVSQNVQLVSELSSKDEEISNLKSEVNMLKDVIGSLVDRVKKLEMEKEKDSEGEVTANDVLGNVNHLLDEIWVDESEERRKRVKLNPQL